jgi:hypothetical protein
MREAQVRSATLGPHHNSVVADSIGGIVFVGLRPQIFLPWAQAPTRQTHLVVHAPSSLEALPDPIRRQASALAPDIPLGAFRSMEALVDDAVAPLRMTAWLISCFGLFAVVLAALGIYGVVAYAASRRTCEIGVRIALGARPADVLRLMMRRGGRLVITGLALGLTLSVGMTMLLSGAAAEERPPPPTRGGWSGSPPSCWHSSRWPPAGFRRGG